MKGRFRELRESEDYLHQEDEEYIPTKRDKTNSELRSAGLKSRVARAGFRRYARLQTHGLRHKSRRRQKPQVGNLSRTASLTAPASYFLSQFRHDPPHRNLSILPLELEIPDFELWITELWNDFLIEPTPYLVTSAIIYLGFILFVSRYYSLIWWGVCFFGNFVPWDDDGGGAL